MAMASSSEGNFDPYQRLQRTLESAIFKQTGVFLQPDDSVAILEDILPLADVHLSLMHAEVALNVNKARTD